MILNIIYSNRLYFICLSNILNIRKSIVCKKRGMAIKKGDTYICSLNILISNEVNS